MNFFVNELLFTRILYRLVFEQNERNLKKCFKMNWSLLWVGKVLFTTVNRIKEQAASVLIWVLQIF